MAWQIAVKEVVKKVGEKIGEKVAKKAAGKAAQKVGEKATKEATQKVEEEAAKEVAEEVSKEVTEQTGEQVAEQVAEQVGSEASQEAAEEGFSEGGKDAPEDVLGENIPDAPEGSQSGENGPDMQESMRKDAQKKQGRDEDGIKEQLGMDKEGSGEMVEDVKKIKEDANELERQLSETIDNGMKATGSAAKGTKEAAEKGDFSKAWSGGKDAAKAISNEAFNKIGNAVGKKAKGGAVGNKIARTAADAGVSLDPLKDKDKELLEGGPDKDR